MSTSSATSADDVEMDIVLQVSGDSGTSTGSEGTRRGIWPQGRGGQEGEEGEGKRGRGGVGGRGFGELSRILSSAMKQSGSTALSWSCSVDELVEAFSRARGRAKEIWPLGSARAAAELGGLLRQVCLSNVLPSRSRRWSGILY